MTQCICIEEEETCEKSHNDKHFTVSSEEGREFVKKMYTYYVLLMLNGICTHLHNLFDLATSASTLGDASCTTHSGLKPGILPSFQTVNFNE